MGLSLSIVITASFLASLALFFLLGSSINENKKQKILMIMGVLIFLSILISNFKSQDIFTFSLLNNSSQNKIKSIFSNSLPAYSKKYELDPAILSSSIYDRNYGPIEKKDYNEYIVYISGKSEGASFFLHQLTQKLRDQGIPAFYVKIESPSGAEQEFFRKTGLSSYDAFKSALEYYIHKKERLYVIVDNAERLPNTIWSILTRYGDDSGLNIILNTEHASELLKKISLVDEGNLESQLFFGKFQVQKFSGPDQNILEKISPSNWFSKKIPINFDTISSFKSGSTEEEILLKSGNSDSIVANYFGLSNPFNKLKKLSEKGSVSLGKFKETGILYETLEQMEELRLAEIKNGQIFLQ